jgi:hypothetical protein
MTQDHSAINEDQKVSAMASENKQEVKIVTEDVQFIEFAKNYLGLLATVASLPILSSAIGVLPPPATNDKLVFLNSFLCLVSFAACFLLKGVLGKIILSNNDFTRLLPFVFVMFIIGFAVFLIGEYQARYDLVRAQAVVSNAGSTLTPTPIPTTPTATATTGPTSTTVLSSTALLTTLYLTIYPLIVLATGIVLVTAFTQQRSQTIQNIIDAKLQEQEKYMTSLIENHAAYRDLAKQNPLLATIGDGLLKRQDYQLLKLSEGQVEVLGTETARTQGLLLDNFDKRFDAVSDRDLEFWLYKDNPQIGREYDQLTVKAVERGVTATRIFIFSDEDLFGRHNDIVSVLQRHQADGVGWAVALYSELSPTDKDGARAMDFAIFENKGGYKAVSFFRDFKDATRRFAAIFDTENNKEDIQRQEEQYKGLLLHCWLASNLFIEKRKDMLDSRLSNSSTVRKTIQQRTIILRQRLNLADIPDISSSVPENANPSSHRTVKQSNFINAFIRGKSTPSDDGDNVNTLKQTFLLEVNDINKIGEFVELLQKMRQLSRERYD